jgi:hypothetical protein
MESVFVWTVLIVGGGFLLYRYFNKPTWVDLPTLRAYLDKFPSCQTDRGIRCRHCRSGSIRNFGWKSADDARRLFICNHCGQILYRNELDA